MARSNSIRAWCPRVLSIKRTLLFFGFAIALLRTHLPWLRLPYFWDEAGYYVPAARDLLLTGALIPHSTLTNAHPPLVMAYLALAWKIFGYSPLVARTAMILIAAFALLGIFELARKVATPGVAIASLVCVAVYPVFFAQSPMALVDLAAAAFTIWALLAHMSGERIQTAIWFSIAALCKETAIITPLALFLFFVLYPEGEARGTPVRWRLHRVRENLYLLIPLLPLVVWFAFHFVRTGQVFGNPEFFRYNVSATLNPLRILFALIHRGWQLTGYMNLAVLTLAAALAMFFPAQRDGKNSVERQRIAVPTQLAFAVVIVVHWLFFSVIGGAALARYMLPAIPLVIIICVSTIRRRIRGWPVVIALVVAAFVAGIFINPPYVFAPEDNLAYTDYVALHQRAAEFVTARYPRARVLTAWPASDELSKPYLGYFLSPLRVLQLENFTREELEAAAQNQQFDVVYVFSTKYEPAHSLPMPGFWRRAQERFFGYHEDVSPALAAQILGGEIKFSEKRSGQWVAVIETPQIKNAKLIGDHFLRQIVPN